MEFMFQDLIVTQEEYSKLYSEHQRFKESTQQDISALKVWLTIYCNIHLV